MHLGQPVEEQPAEEAGEHPHEQEEARPTSGPARAVRGQATARYDDMHVWVVRHGRAPGVEHGGQPDLCPKVLRIGGDGQQSVGGGAEQQVVDHGLVLEGHGRDNRWQGADDVVVWHGQQVGLRPLQPRPRRIQHSLPCRECGLVPWRFVDLRHASERPDLARGDALMRPVDGQRTPLAMSAGSYPLRVRTKLRRLQLQ